MKDVDSHLAAALIRASRTSLEDLTITPPEGFQKFVNAQRERQDAVDPLLMHLQNLRLDLRTFQSHVYQDTVLSSLDDAVGVLDFASTSNAASLNLEFNLVALLHLSDRSSNPSLELFEKSVARFTSRPATVSFVNIPPRKNRRGTFWAPILARVFPLLYNQGALNEAGGSPLFILQSVALTRVDSLDGRKGCPGRSPGEHHGPGHLLRWAVSRQYIR